MKSLRLVTIVVALLSAPAFATTDIRLSSDPGDFIGGGQQFHLDDSSGNWYEPGTVYFSYNLFPPLPALPWFFTFSGPQGSPLAEGVYQAQQCPPYSVPMPCMSVMGQGHGCNTLTGFFEVRHLTRDSNGQISSAWIIFEQHCDGASPALRGDVRLNLATPLEVPLLSPVAFAVLVLALISAAVLSLARAA